MAVLTPQEKTRIEERIRAAEKRTSGEIVVVVTRSSGGYAWIHWAWGVLGAFAATGGVLSSHPWGISGLGLLEWQLVGASVGILISLVPAGRRLVLSRKTMAAKVHRESLACFVGRGIAETRDRTGILIYLSEFEHRVEILADRGIHEKLGTGYWDTQVRHIIEGIRSGRAAKALGDSIDQMAEKLALHFPHKAGDKNELPDKLE